MDKSQTFYHSDFCPDTNDIVGELDEPIDYFKTHRNVKIFSVSPGDADADDVSVVKVSMKSVGVTYCSVCEEELLKGLAD